MVENRAIIRRELGNGLHTKSGRGDRQRVKVIGISLVVMTLTSWGGTADLEWVRQFGGNHWVQPAAVCVDDLGNGYVTGSFAGVADFDPGPDTYTLTADGSGVFVCKLDEYGSLVWATSWVGLTAIETSGIAVDKSGQVYVTGYSPNIPKVRSNNIIPPLFYDMFVAKLASDGSPMWSRRIAGKSGDRISGIAVSDSGSIVVSGSFRDTIDLDPGSDVQSATSAGADDIYVCLLDAGGEQVWSVQIGGVGSDRDARVAFTTQGEVVCAGSFSNSVDFDPGAGVTELTASGDRDVFVCRFDGNGALQWARRMGGAALDLGSDVTVDTLGNVYTTGALYGPGDFDPGPNSADLVPTGANGVFVSKLDNNGDFVWAKCIANTTSEYTPRIVLDGPGNVYVMGSFFGTAIFEPEQSDAVSASGACDVFIAKLDSTGMFQGAAVVGGESTDIGEDLAVSPNGAVWATGWFTGTSDFDPGVGTAILVAMSGESDGFVLNLNGIPNMPAAYEPGIAILIFGLTLFALPRIPLRRR